MGSSSYRPWGEIGNTAIPWEMKFIFRIGQTTNIKMRIGIQQQMSYQVQPANGIALRFDTSAGDTTTFTWEIRASNATSIIPGPPVDTNWHTIKLRGTGTAGKIALSVDGGAESTVCPSGGGCTANANAITTGLGPYWYVGADTAAAANTIDVDYFGFWARVSTNASGERF